MRTTIRARPFTTALIVLVLVAAPGYWRIEQLAQRANETSDAVKAETERATIDACSSRRDAIIIIRQLVELTADTGGDLTLTKADGFDELSPELRVYLVNLEALLNAGPPADTGFRDRALDLLVEPTC